MSDQKLIKETMSAVTDLLLKKNRDYGSSFRASGILSGALDVKTKLHVRIDDKLERLANLLEKETDGEVQDESIIDTVTDLVGYFVLLLILLNEERTTGKPMSVIESESRVISALRTRLERCEKE